MEVKVIERHLLLNFSVEPNKKSQIPVKLRKTSFGIHTKKGLYFDFKLRHN